MKSIKELTDIIRNRSEDGILLRFADENGVHSVTNSSFIADVEQGVRGLHRLFGGETEGRHIAVAAQSGYEYVIAVFACALAGAVLILVNPLEEESRIEAMLAGADVELVIREPEEIVKAGYSEDSADIDIDSLMKDLPDDFSFLLFTSGTEGNMKGVMLSQRGILASAGDVTGVFGDIASVRPDISFKSCYVMLPMYHVFGLSIMFTALAGGVILDLCVDFRQFYRDLRLLGSEIIACPHMAFKMFVSDLSRGKKNKWGSGLKFIFSGAAGLPLKELEAIMDNDVFIAFGYGMTEIAGPVAINSYMDKLGSVGKAAPRTRIEIRDNEIYIKNNSVMLGYYNDPEATAVAVKDGWIATGDYGYLDEEGFLYITGRKKNLIILSSGENVSPEELEARLYANRAVKECKVYEKGDRIAADIYAPEATEEEIRAFVSDLNGKLPGFKRIYSVRFLKSEMEKTASGKIKR